jgi:murein DD-endopeptidase MepM/ murein hydrolase activator NlpD
VDKQIAEMEAELKKLEQEKKVTSTGSFIWPTNSSRTVTSSFGMRTDPVTGKIYRMHNGIDIGASWGTPILAADSGIVTVASYDQNGYGNYVVVSHSNGTKTLYAHMSAKYVSVGDVVKQGGTIGAVGSTGNSTAPHLHFEIFVGTSRVNPLNYFTNYTTAY